MLIQHVLFSNQSLLKMPFPLYIHCKDWLENASENVKPDFFLINSLGQNNFRFVEDETNLETALVTRM